MRGVLYLCRTLFLISLVCLSFVKSNTVENFSLNKFELENSTEFHKNDSKYANFDDKIAKIFTNIKTTPTDVDRQYRGILLKNGLKIMLISDPTAKISSARLSVKVGSFHDPWEYMGMAHFVEHMLFLGSEKYPDKGYFDEFLTQNGGFSNAETDSETTEYYFSVPSNNGFKKTLDVFAHMFTSPQFNESQVEKEVSAVDSEYTSNLKDDGWRLHYILKSVGDPKHVFRKFSTGDKRSLLGAARRKNVSLAAEARKFFETKYFPNRTTLAIFGKENLDELSNFIVPLFSKFQNPKNGTQKPHDTWGNPFNETFIGKKVAMVPLIKANELHLNFPMPFDLEPYRRKNAFSYIGRFFSDNSPGSFSYKMKHNNLTKSISAYYNYGGKDFGFYMLQCDLTDQGLSEIEPIIKHFFAYVNQIRQRTNETWMFDEMKINNNNSFNLADKSDGSSLVSSIASELHDIDFENVLVENYQLEDQLDSKFIDYLLSFLNVDNFNYMIVSQNVTGDLVEKYYGTNYSISNIPPEFIEQLREISNDSLLEGIRYPVPNPYLAKNLQLSPKSNETDFERPKLLFDTDQQRLWYGKDVVFRRPEIMIRIKFRSPKNRGIRSDFVEFLFITTISEQLDEQMNDASRAGYGFSASGGAISFSGYVDKMAPVMEDYLNKLFALKIDAVTFANAKKSMLEMLENSNLESSYELAENYFNDFTRPPSYYTPEQAMTVLQGISINDVVKVHSEMLSRWHAECFVYGDVAEEEAKSIFTNVTSFIKSKRASDPILNSELDDTHTVKWPSNSQFIYRKTLSVQSQPTTLVTFQNDAANDREKLTCALLVLCLSGPFYTKMRTEQELGYTVSFHKSSGDFSNFFLFMVSGPYHPEYVETRIEAFIDEMQGMIESINETQLNDTIKSQRDSLKKKPDTAFEQGGRFWGQIASGRYYFNYREVYDKLLETITKDDLLTLIQRALAKNSPDRRKLSIHMYINDTMLNDPNNPNSTSFESATNNATVITNINEFTRYLPLYPLNRPVMKLKPIGL